MDGNDFRRSGEVDPDGISRKEFQTGSNRIGLVIETKTPTQEKPAWVGHCSRPPVM
jgi:hypothetical protein